MTDKEKILGSTLWLYAQLSDAQEVMDFLKGTKLYRHGLKQKINALEREIDSLFSTKEFKQFYSAEGGGDGITMLGKWLEEARESFLEEIVKSNNES